VQLQQVERFSLQVLQAALDECGEVGTIVAGCRVRVQSTTGLGGDVDRLVCLSAQFRDQPFAQPVAVHIGCVKEVHAQVQRAAQGGQRFLLLHRPPGAPNRPRAKTQRGYLPASTS